MGRPKTIQGELKDKIAEALQTKTRKQVCEEFSVSYQQLSKEFGHKWVHSKGETVAVEETLEESVN